MDQHYDVLPAELPGVIAVSAIGAQRAKSGYSSYGLGVIAVTAPGGDLAQQPDVSPNGCVLSTVPSGYDYACGTSMAAPHASGVAALLASAHPRARPEELATLLRQQAEPLPDTSSRFYGHGLANALAAVSVSEPLGPGSVPDGADR